MELLSWESLEGHLRQQNPSTLSMGGSRGVCIGFSPDTGRLYLRLPTGPDATVPVSPYAELSTAVMRDGEGAQLEVSTAAARMFRQFHALASIVTEEFEAPDRSAVAALSAAVKQWRQLTSLRAVLSEHQQLGLRGELLFLNALLAQVGPLAVNAWTGWNEVLPERHDFRLPGADLEIKSTRMQGRKHFIHGLRQLMPLGDFPLFILSMRFEAAGLGPGSTLGDEVASIRVALRGAEAEEELFESLLASAGYHDEDAAHYGEKLRLADSPILVPVDAMCPRITGEMLEASISAQLVSRVDDVTYRVDVDGMGVAQGAPGFVKVLGSLKMGAV